MSYLNLIFIYIKHVHDCWTFGIHPTMPKVHSALKHSPCTVPITCLQCSFYMHLSGQQLCLLTWHIVCFKAIWAVHTIPAVSSSDVKSVWRRVCTLYTLRFFKLVSLDILSQLATFMLRVLKSAFISLISDPWIQIHEKKAEQQPPYPRKERKS